MAARLGGEPAAIGGYNRRAMVYFRPLFRSGVCDEERLQPSSRAPTWQQTHCTPVRHYRAYGPQMVPSLSATRSFGLAGTFSRSPSAIPKNSSDHRSTTFRVGLVATLHFVRTQVERTSPVEVRPVASRVPTCKKYRPMFPSLQDNVMDREPLTKNGEW
jgi:hypothetical protein